MHTRLSVNGVLKQFPNKGDTQLTETYRQKNDPSILFYF